MIEGLRKPDEGSIRICGKDIANNAEEIKDITGVRLQDTTFCDKVEVRS